MFIWGSRLTGVFMCYSYSEIASIDEKKKSAELQNRSYEVEVRMDEDCQ